MSFEESVIWITGATSGIGEALALELAPRGARLILSGRRRDRLDALAERCGAERCRVLPLDLEDTAGLERAAAEAERHWGRIDALVNNAGVSQRSLFVDTSPEVIRRLATIDFLGPVLLSRAVVQGMVERGSGALLFVTSVVGKVSVPLRALYSASKHALHGFADALRAELWGAGVRVTVVAPGFVKTEISYSALEGDGSSHAKLDPGQAGGISAAACASRIARALERGEREVYVGVGLRGGLGLVLSRVAPGLLARLVRGSRPS